MNQQPAGGNAISAARPPGWPPVLARPLLLLVLSPTLAGLALLGPTEAVAAGGGCTARVSLATSPNPAAVGQVTAATATVTTNRGAPTGSVTFTSGSRSLGTATLTASGKTSGQATVTTSFSTVGVFAVTATLTSVQNGTGPCTGSASAYELVYQPWSGGTNNPPASASSPIPTPTLAPAPAGVPTGTATAAPAPTAGSSPSRVLPPSSTASSSSSPPLRTFALAPASAPAVAPPEAPPVVVSSTAATPPEVLLPTFPVASGAGLPGIIPSLYFYRHPIFGVTLAVLAVLTALALLVGWAASRSGLGRRRRTARATDPAEESSR